MPAFSAKLIRPEGTGTWTYLNVPFDAASLFGSKAHIKVKGTVNGVSYRSTLMVHGSGTYYMVVNQAIREAASVQAGDTVEVTMDKDTEPRTVSVPQDLQSALEEHDRAGHYFAQLSYSAQKEYTDWLESAKKPETRISRIQKAISLLEEGKRLKG
ncbi:YdeI/OmpD-associated family protein [Paenibacillus sp. UNC451MF]|uniref:YdeI/OmpD-associated family protein n=1 Tax=Paenibacillus sp. UNC451MF TaxID=1449063 RepID=UPI000691855B|nr:YdeI/OmpD-associated family protein [Paenibacillus sp. UNC451MF]